MIFRLSLLTFPFSLPLKFHLCFPDTSREGEVTVVPKAVPKAERGRGQGDLAGSLPSPLLWGLGTAGKLRAANERPPLNDSGGSGVASG